jgi:hypothetical protein
MTVPVPLGDLGAWLANAAACRLVELQRPPVEADPGTGRLRRDAAVVSAYHGAVAGPGLPLVAGWCRPRADGPVSVLLGGAVLDVPGGPEVRLTLPPGGRGTLLPPGDAFTQWAGVPVWTRVAGVVDGLLAEAVPLLPGRGERRPSLEDCLLAVWPGPFGWLLVAEPVPPVEVDDLAVRVAGVQREAMARGDRSPEYALAARRAECRHRELRAAAATGLWRVHLLAGAGTEAGARAVAGLVAASTDLTGLGYALVPTGLSGDLASVLAATGVPSAGAGAAAARTSGAGALSSSPGAADVAAVSPFVASSALVGALSGVPATEIPGVRLVLRPEFDVTPETEPGLTRDRATPDGPAGGTGVGAGRGGALVLGRVLDRGGVPTGDLRLPLESLNRHTFVCGATGAGKSQTVRHLLEQASAQQIPWLVIEPAKAEYAAMAARLGDGSVVRIRPGDPAVPPVGLNPLEPAPGFPLQTHVDLVRALFTAAFQAEEPFPQVLSAALTRCYEGLGWNLALGRPRTAGVTPRYPTLSDLQATAERVVAEIGYGPEVAANVGGFVRVRLGSLRLGTPGRFFEGGHTLDLERLLARNVVVEIDDVGDDRDKAFLIGTVLIALAEHLRVRHRKERPGASTGLRHLTVIEEAHRLLRRTEQQGPAAHAVEMFAALLAEIRAYGEGLIVAEQIPAKLAPDVVKNTAVKIVHRLPARDDRDTVGATMNLTDAQSRYVVTLEPGTAAVFCDGMDFPVLTRMPDGTSRETTTPATAPVTDVIGHTHPACSPDCAQRPCTLEDIDTAWHLLTDQPAMVLWAELAVLAHLTGNLLPVPDTEITERLGGLDGPLRDTAIGLAVHDAVASRSALLAGTHSPRKFAEHVAADLRGVFTGQQTCEGVPRSWLAPPYKWGPVLLALHRTGGADTGVRHPDSAVWESRYGQAIPGRTWQEQRQAVTAWVNTGMAEPERLEALLFGSTDPSALEAAVRAERRSADWESRLTQALVPFEVRGKWPLGFLHPDHGGWNRSPRDHRRG